jgi:2-hydroxy-3-keto-5-methylthiopentenyl-1-phosphate phosphatase
VTETSENSTPAIPVGVVCDFDGTATLLDIGDEISRHFGGAAWWDQERARFAKGELDTRGIIEAIYQKVYADEGAVRAFAAERARLRPGFQELVGACAAAGAPFILASGGLRQYVEAVLEAHLDPLLLGHVEIRANEGHFDPPQHLRVSFPWEEMSREQGCTACGSCKRVSVADLRQRGVRYVIGLGDGFADRCLVEHADEAFARRDSYLANHCAREKLPHTLFDTLEGVAEAVRRRAAL